MEQNSQNLFDLQIDQQSTSFLGEAAKWSKFLSIVGFVVCGLMVLLALFAGSFMASMSQFGGQASMAGSVGGAFVTIIYILIALLYFFPCLYLFNFSTQMQLALRNNNQESLNTSFKNLKSCFRFLGILTIIVIGFYLLIFLFGIGAAMSNL